MRRDYNFVTVVGLTNDEHLFQSACGDWIEKTLGMLKNYENIFQ